MKKIIFICTGNTCRSPMAEAYLKSFMFDFEVLSRGIYADGSAVSNNSVEAMKELGISIKPNSEQLSKSDLDADLFVCMSKSHADFLKSIDISIDKITVLPGGIPDPYGGTLSDYISCRNSIIKGVNELIFGGKITGYSVKSATESDALGISELEKKTFSEPWSEQAIIDSMNASTLFFVSIQDNRLLGYIGVSCAADEGYITNVAVYEENKRKGVATALINRVLCEAREKKLSFVSLEVRASNENAIKLYEKLGFKLEGIRKNFYRLPLEDAKIMTRRF